MNGSGFEKCEHIENEELCAITRKVSVSACVFLCGHWSFVKIVQSCFVPQCKIIFSCRIFESSQGDLGDENDREEGDWWLSS